MVNSFEDMGKRVLIEPSEATDFFRGIERLGLTGVANIKYSFYKGNHATVIEMNIGTDYKGNLIPEDAEGLRIYNLADGRQAIHYLHSAPLYKRCKVKDKDNVKEKWDIVGCFMKMFANDFRAKEKNLKIEDILRDCSKPE